MGSTGGPARKSGAKSAPKEPATYQFRDIVLAKVRGYPPWPGMVVDPEAVPPAVQKERPSKKSSFYCVRFFPVGDHSWLPAKELSKLQKHEIESYINEPSKKNGDLTNAYKIALDPTDWEKQIEETIKNNQAAEAEAEVDQLQSEGDDGESGVGASVGGEKPKPAKKRKRDSEAAAPSKKGGAAAASTTSSAKQPKPKSDSASAAGAAGGKKKGGAAKGSKKGGTKSKNAVESEDDGEAEEEDDAGPSKKASPPPAKKPKRGKEEEEVDESLASDPEAVKVRTWRHSLQKVFLGKTAPKDEEIVGAAKLFTEIENYDKMNIQYLTFSKIAKVMRHVVALPDEKVPRDGEFKFRERAQKLVDKWHQILNAVKVNGGATGGTPAPANGATTPTAGKDETVAASSEAAAPAAVTAVEDKAKTTNGEDAEMTDAQAAAPAAEAEPAPAATAEKDKDVPMDGAAENKESHAGDLTALPDVTMSEAGAETA